MRDPAVSPERTQHKRVLEDYHDQQSYDLPTPSRRARRRKSWIKEAIAVVILLALAAAVGRYIYQPNPNPKPEPETKTEPRRVSALEYPAILGSKITISDIQGVKWIEPSAIATNGTVGYIVDPISDELYSLNLESQQLKKITLTENLSDPMAIDIHNDVPYIADSRAGRVVVVKNGKVTSLKLPADSMPARPIGIHVASSGKILVSDADNHNVYELDASGRVVKTLGLGKRDGSKKGFNVPGGITTDNKGNIYVVDILNARVQKFNPDGKYLDTYGEPGDTAGALARPKDVAVDSQGNVYVSDGLQFAISVFSPDGKYLGFIGRAKPGDKDSEPLFKAVAGIKITGDNLYAVDRLGGVFVFKLQED